jgi:chromosomal replication initiator protein
MKLARINIMEEDHGIEVVSMCPKCNIRLDVEDIKQKRNNRRLLSIIWKVLYVKTDQFVEEYVRLASKKKFEEFNNKYRDVEVLLIDDIQFLAKKEKSQIEFFKLFETLHGTQKQIVITSDRSASELKDVMSRLTSRFEWGVTVDINRPELNHRIQILKKKLTAETSDSSLIPNDVIEYIASVFDNNVRELEGALKRVLFYCTAFNLDFTVKNATLALENLVKPRTNGKFLNENKINNILSIVSDYYRISTSDLISKKRTSKYVFPRQVSMYLIKTMYDIPYKKIGTYFNNRDHSTVMHSVEKITNEMEMDKNVKRDVDKLKIKCGEN